jgi:uncharacterized protein with GYD domain
MPTYITLWNYTQQGLENIQDSPERLDAAVDLMGSLGGELHAVYLTMGEYDLVTVAEFPDDDAAAKTVIGIAQGGNVSPMTMKAWPEAEYRELIGSM